MDIVVLDGYTLNPGDLDWGIFEKMGHITVYDRTSADQVISRIANAEMILTNKTPLTADILVQCPSLKYIGVLATGYNVVDVNAARQQGVLVTHIPAYGTQSVAQFTIALLLEICHHIGDHANAVKGGAWSASQDWCFWQHPLIELAGKTLGVVGFGRIGQATARIAQALGMSILTYSANGDPCIGDIKYKAVELDDLFKTADVITLHCPLVAETVGMINQATIATMKQGVIIINSSRGSLIVEADLRDALNAGKVAAAASDVVSTEPISADNPLLAAKNMLITPHIAWAPRAARQRLMAIAAANVAGYLAGTPINGVNG